MRYAILLVLLPACRSVSPPASQIPDAKSAIARLDATYANVTGISGSAKMDYLGDNGRVRGDVSVLASGPASLRFAITADVVGAAGEVTSDGLRFQADDRTSNRYIVGDAKPCNIARITQIPLPLNELVPMLWGMRPHLDGPIKCDSISWSSDGYYVVMMSKQVAGSTEGGLSHELHVAPYTADWEKPWSQQRMHLLGVSAWAASGSDGTLVYRVTMKDHQSTSTAKPIVDQDGINPDVPPSGPNVTVELPRMIHVEVPSKKSDVVFKYTEAFVNPPLIPNAFKLMMKPGVPVEESRCE
ncbi:MAG: hypothetical protein ACXWP4_04615 [Polyangiales bacterium]